MLLRILTFMLGAVAMFRCGAQERFSRRYDPFSQVNTQEAWSIEFAGDSGYFVIHMSRLFVQGEELLIPCILRLNLGGEQIDVAYTAIDTLHPAIYCGWSNSSARAPNGDIIIGGGRSDDTGFDESALIRFNGMGEFDTLFVYGNNLGYIGRQAKCLSDGYVLVGGCEANGSFEGFLLKTDTNGTQQWVQIYPGPSYDEFVAVDLVPGGGYYLGGLKFVPGQNTQNWVFRVDEDGEVMWERAWGGAFGDGNAHLMTATDGQAVICSSRGTTASGYAYLYMAKLDSADGSFVWEHFYGSPTFNTTLFAVKEVEPFGDLIATGQAFQNGGEVGVLLRTTSEGDSLWMRTYNYHDGLVENGDAQLRDVLPTPDGGFIAVGVAFGIGPYSQDVWVVKTDSMGCLEPGCHLIQGMEAQVTNLRDALTVAPNPVAAGSIVQVSIDLPASFTPQGGLRLTVVSSDGRVVQEQRLGSVTPEDPRSGLSGVSPMTLALPALRAGLYHLHLSDATRWISAAKLVVE